MRSLVVRDLEEAAADPLGVTSRDEVVGAVLGEATVEEGGLEVLQVQRELQEALVCENGQYTSRMKRNGGDIPLKVGAATTVVAAPTRARRMVLGNIVGMDK